MNKLTFNTPRYILYLSTLKPLCTTATGNSCRFHYTIYMDAHTCTIYLYVSPTIFIVIIFAFNIIFYFLISQYAVIII